MEREWRHLARVGRDFLFADASKIQFNSAVDAIITAPTSGPYEGIFMYEADGLANSQLAINDAFGFRLKGLVYLPSRDVVFNGGSLMVAHEMSVVFNALILDNARWNLTTGGRSMGPASAATASVLIE